MKVSGIAAIFAFVALGTVACAGTTEDSAPVADGAEAVTSVHLYDCRTGADQGGTLQRFELAMSPTSAEITDVSKDAAPPDSGRIDPSYHPTPQLAGAIRYRGFDKIASSFDEVSVLDLLVPKEFQGSPEQGKLLIRTTGPEGGGSTSYFCKTKTKKLAVDLSVKARLNCNVSLECTNDNPPGQTCLDSAFVNQTTASSATLRTSYLDHFGVHADPRNVDVGASTKLTRTKDEFSATFPQHSLELTYRAGVTYTGKLVLPSGKSATAKCNDLAMLD